MIITIKKVVKGFTIFVCLLCFIVLMCAYFNFRKMASLNPLAMILSQKSMDGTNYNQWKTNLYIVLDYEKSSLP